MRGRAKRMRAAGGDRFKPSSLATIPPWPTTSLAIGVVLAILAELVRTIIADEFAQSRGQVLVLSVAGLLLVVLLILLFQLAVLRDDVREIRDRLPLSFSYYQADTVESVVRLNGAAQSVIEDAPNGATILAVNSYLEVYEKHGVDPRISESLVRYLEAYERRFSTLNYKRLVQVKDRSEPSELLKREDHLDQAYVQHYRKMLLEADRPKKPIIGLFEVPALIPASFVIVKQQNGGGTIIWEVFKHRSDKSEVEGEQLLATLGIIIISDAGGALVGMFEGWFNLIEQGGTVPPSVRSV